MSDDSVSDHFSVEGLLGFLQSYPTVVGVLGGSPADWKVQEVGDGNLNFVFFVQGPNNSVIVKQAVPYIRVVQQYKLSPERINYEALTLQHHQRLAPGFVPEVLVHDSKRYAVVMEYLSPHVILRKGLIANHIYPNLAEQLSSFLAHTLFGSSDLAISSVERRELVARYCGNSAMCKITEEAVLSSPFQREPVFGNRFSDDLKSEVDSLQSDAAVMLAVSKLKGKFLADTSALVHGDLHSGSIMLTDGDLRVIDSEFAFVGPMGFDVGLLFANLLLSVFSKCTPGQKHVTEYQAYLLRVVSDTWKGFTKKFRQLWDKRGEQQVSGVNNAFPDNMCHGDARQQAQKAYLAAVFEDTMGFCACEMIRRVIGVAHVEDIDSIQDNSRRIHCERSALRFAKWLLLRNPDMSALIRKAEHAAASSTTALVLVAKFPTPGSTKTRLAASIGDEEAASFSKACLQDLLTRLSCLPEDVVTKYLYYAPQSAEASFRELLDECGADCAASWHLKQMTKADDDLKSSDLSGILTSAVDTLSPDHDGVVFIGSDCPYVTPHDILNAVTSTRDNQAFLMPASDGGYVLCAIPPTHQPVFQDVRWSSALTCLDQLRQLQGCGFQVQIGSTYDDIDTEADLVKLKGSRDVLDANSKLSDFLRQHA